ncbi:MAG TPA: hypothetical protein VNQ79_02040 [Blastocatellia bacterium]|nr:hypothetical protein [Blastocatellia bacterium]
MKKGLTLLLSFLLLTLSVPAQSASQSPARAQSAEESSPKTDDIVLPEGTTAKLSLQTALSSKLSEVGDQVIAVLYEPVRDKDGRTAIARGTEFIGRVTQVQAAKRPQKQATLTVSFDRMRMPYGEEKIATIVTAIDDYGNDEKLKSKDGEGKVGGGHSGGRTARNAGTGAGLGSVGGIIIAAAGGGLGGLAAAAGVGAVGGVLMTKGNDIKLAPGTVLRIRFERPVTVPAFDSDRPVK